MLLKKHDKMTVIPYFCIVFEKKKKDKFNNIFEYIAYSYMLPSNSKQLLQFQKYKKCEKHA